MLQSTGSNGYSTDSKLTRLRYGTRFGSFLVPQRRGYSVDHLLEINYTDQMGSKMSPDPETELDYIVDGIQPAPSTAKAVNTIHCLPSTFLDSRLFVRDLPINSLELAREIGRLKKDDDEPFLILNLDRVIDLYKLWARELPTIKPYYAVKCNPNGVLLRTLAALGAGFDCASREEIETILKLGLEPGEIIYANPCKPRTFIQHARRRKVLRMTFDSPAELDKIAKCYPEAELILRIAVANPSASFELSKKYGADPALSLKLLRKAKELGLKVIGISFHVGSRSQDPSAYERAIQESRGLFEVGRSMGHEMAVLNVGGGFPGDDEELFKKMCKMIRTSIQDHFSDVENLEVMGEPGRYFATSSFCSVATIFHTKEVPASRITKNVEDEDRTGMMYYLNDGVYGTYSGVIVDDSKPTGRPLFDTAGECYPSTVWGPTCDCLDVVENNKLLPELKMGDMLYYEDMGAYSTACSTEFNHFTPPVVEVAVSKENWRNIREKIAKFY